jgi:hypothetical protein
MMYSSNENDHSKNSQKITRTNHIKIEIAPKTMIHVALLIGVICIIGQLFQVILVLTAALITAIGIK